MLLLAHYARSAANIIYFKCCLLCKNNNPGGTEKKLGDSFGSVDVNKDVDFFCEHICDDSRKKWQKNAS